MEKSLIGQDPGSKQSETHENESLKLHYFEISRSDENFSRPMIFYFTLATPIGSSVFFSGGRPSVSSSCSFSSLMLASSFFAWKIPSAEVFHGRLTLPHLTSSCSVTLKAFTPLCHPAILKCVSGFRYEIFVQDRTFTHCPTPSLEGQVMQFPWPFMRNLPDTVEPTRSQLV